jgi:hypothetical protein
VSVCARGAATVAASGECGRDTRETSALTVCPMGVRSADGENKLGPSRFVDLKNSFGKLP